MILLTTNCQHLLEHIKSKRIPEKKSTSVSLTMLKPLTVWITANCGKFLKRCEYQTTLPASWETCMQVRRQQWAVDMGKWTGSKLRKEPVKAGCILSSCLFNLYTVCASVHVQLVQLCSTLCYSMECSSPGYSVHGILQAGILEWVAKPSSRESSQPQVSNSFLPVSPSLQADSLPTEPPGKP